MNQFRTERGGHVITAASASWVNPEKLTNGSAIKRRVTHKLMNNKKLSYRRETARQLST